MLDVIARVLIYAGIAVSACLLVASVMAFFKTRKKGILVNLLTAVAVLVVLIYIAVMARDTCFSCMLSPYVSLLIYAGLVILTSLILGDTIKTMKQQKKSE
ncbi:MAG: hypothetical protein RR058_03355 [Oscillospiraceae bacterium]